MSKMGDYLLELEEDFEWLSTTGMEWNSALWAEQVEGGRFNITPHDWKYTYIHWFENYASVIAAKAILREIDEEFKVVNDDFSGEWAILTTYQSNAWKGL